MDMRNIWFVTMDWTSIQWKKYALWKGILFHL